MSARKIDLTHSVPTTSHAQMRLSLPSNAVRIRKSGIEFRTTHPIPAWTEMTLDLQRPDAKKFHCTGVVVACEGNRHSGYSVSLLFTNLSRHSQALLSSFA
jgi:hypothetical protein